MGVSVLLRFFISSNEFATLLTPSSVYMKRTPCTTMGPMIPKEMKYDLHYSDVRGDVLPQPYGTNTSCSIEDFPSLYYVYEYIVSHIIKVTAFTRYNHTFCLNEIGSSIIKLYIYIYIYIYIHVESFARKMSIKDKECS